MKRIALIGNMNNNFFALARYLRDAGHDAHVFYRIAMEHFQPRADTYTEEYKDYCHPVNWLDNGFHNIDKEEVTRVLAGYDFYIGQGEEAAVAYACGFNMNVYYPYGSDVYKYAQLPPSYSLASQLVSIVSRDKTRPTFRQMQEGTMARYLRGVIANADHILAEPTNDAFEGELQKLNYKGRYEKVALPIIYTGEYELLNNGSKPDGPYVTAIDQLRSAHDMILLYHGRQEWKTWA